MGIALESVYSELKTKKVLMKLHCSPRLTARLPEKSSTTQRQGLFRSNIHLMRRAVDGKNLQHQNYLSRL